MIDALNSLTEGKYRLDGKEIVKCETLREWANWMENGNRKIIQETIYPRFWPFFGKSAWVSTVFLGLDHNFFGGPPLLFETMAFGGTLDQHANRCSTYNQAVEMHHRICMDVEDDLWGKLPR